MTDRLLTQDEVAEFLAVQPRTLEGWRLRGDGPRYVKISPRCVRYQMADLEAWIKSRLIAHTSQGA